jgi:hypothetical protein
MQSAIDLARSRAERFLLSMQVKPGVFDTSPCNKGREKGMLLPGTYNAVNALGLMKRLETVDAAAAASFLRTHRRPIGFYRMCGMQKKDLTYPGFEYDDLHITNYVMAALDYLGYPLKDCELRFLKRYTGKKLDRWLERRDLAKPWSEGNYIVNAASFLIEGARLEVEGCADGIRALQKWHADQQDEYGFFHDTSIEDLTNAFAGATHNFHLYYYFDTPVPNYRGIIDYILTRPTAADSACIDVDEMDILFHFAAYGYRRQDISDWVQKKLVSLLALQEADGGFPDTQYGERSFDGWGKYREPQGRSNCFATWFRLIAIAMADVLLYGRGDRWAFRRTIGIGYANAAYLKEGFSEEELRLQYADVLARAEAKREQRKNDPVFQNLHDERVADLVAVFTRKLETCDRTLLNYNARFTFVVVNEGAFGIEIRDGRGKASPGILPASRLTVITDRKTLTRLMNKKLDSKLAYAMGKLKIRGDIGLALKLGGLL